MERVGSTAKSYFILFLPGRDFCGDHELILTFSSLFMLILKSASVLLIFSNPRFQKKAAFHLLSAVLQNPILFSLLWCGCRMNVFVQVATTCNQSIFPSRNIGKKPLTRSLLLQEGKRPKNKNSQTKCPLAVGTDGITVVFFLDKVARKREGDQ